MKSEGQVKQQLKQIIFRHIQRILRNNFKRCSQTCIFNRQVDSQGLGKNGLIGVCNHETRNAIVLCDSSIVFCRDVPLNCELWLPKDKEVVRRDFKEMLKGDRGLIASNYPDIAALMWVLDSSDIDLITEEAFDEQPISSN
jgi:hypothetical protein